MTILPPKGRRAVPVTAMIVLAGLIAALAWPILPVGGPFGYLDARRDAESGLIKIYAPMTNFGWRLEWRNIVNEKYGIEVGGRAPSCLAGGYQYSYDAAYNAEQRARIVKRFGRDVVQEEMLLAIQNRKPEIPQSRSARQN